MSSYDDEHWNNHFLYHRNLIKKINEKKMIEKNKMNKFYVASPHISNPVENGKNSIWTRITLADATKHAQEILNGNPNQEVCLIVKIVRVVKRAKAPITIEDIR